MLDDIVLSPITQAGHAEDAMDLALRARDYITLEVGHAPDDQYIKDFFTAAPPDLGPSCLQTLSVMSGPAMVGMTCVAEGYEWPDDWWIGLLLLDPAFRGQGIGQKVVHQIKERAAQKGVNWIKLSVLFANPRGLTFWLHQGFTHHRDAPATPQSDGHDRVVLKYKV